MFDNPEDFDWSKLHWQADWNGEDLGFPDRNVVGHYTYHDLNLYIDTENLEILQAWFGDEEDEL
ncbi:hypothetical protein ACYJ80_11875 [Staphylococcus capitis]|uniref:Uncharacterized protein n=3 Tax=Staphylococcus TaxID=1279 RepID=Q5HMV3_STAEQ|nr:MULTISPECIES: hypothetical protein [Staphylococcus]YP_009226767.1 hypothetical protein AXJ01_gp091 [Staphylococcus phage SPbeta-like]EON81125.1 hypothetical protein H700_08785 [Staphylococcus epidermidis 41tr]EON83588.1 hypothetical protein H701_04343 [Staphylococcus epidermidis 528m]EON87094.1 hypothetical protein D592_00125 [Staphylococcus epidermidis 36-1]KKD21589.1 hypothetical protein XA21_10930 [Staphylococcus cohnii subsp. cohnii]QPB07695.1 hypothetical protein PLKLOBMN_00124 [Staph